MPGPVRAFAVHQPVTSIVNTIRDLFAQQPVGTDIWIALAWCVGVLVVAYASVHLPPQDLLVHDGQGGLKFRERMPRSGSASAVAHATTSPSSSLRAGRDQELA